MEDSIINLLEKHNLLVFQEKFYLAGVKSMKDLAQIDKTALRSQFLMLDADINNFETLRNECIRATQSIRSAGAGCLGPSMPISAFQPSGAVSSIFSMDSGPEAIRQTSIKFDQNPIIVCDSKTRNPIGELYEDNGAYLLNYFHSLEPGEVKSKSVKHHTKIQKYNLESSVMYRGLGLIFVIEKIENEHARLGASYDLMQLQELFNKMKLKVIAIPNPTREGIISAIKFEVGMHLSFPSFFIAISSHGKRNEILCADNQVVTVTEILGCCIKIPELLGKPKVFLIEASRCDRRDSMAMIINTSYEHDDPETETPNTYPAATKESDILIAYSCVPGYVACGDINIGSCFIASLCEAYIELEEEREDFVSILTHANHIMLQKSFRKEEHILKQLMHLESTLSKLLIV